MATSPASPIPRGNRATDLFNQRLVADLDLTDPRQHLHQFQYDDLGRLLRDEDPAGGFTALSRTDTEFGHEISQTDALNVTSRYRGEILPDGSRLSLTIGADGGTNISLAAPNGGVTNSLADGTVTIMQQARTRALACSPPFQRL